MRKFELPGNKQSHSGFPLWKHKNISFHCISSENVTLYTTILFVLVGVLFKTEMNYIYGKRDVLSSKVMSNAYYIVKNPVFGNLHCVSSQSSLIFQLWSSIVNNWHCTWIWNNKEFLSYQSESNAFSMFLELASHRLESLQTFRFRFLHICRNNG